MSVEPKAEIARKGGGIRPLGPLGVSAIALIAGTVVMLFVSAIIDWVSYADFERSWGRPQEMPTEWQSSTWAGSIASLLLLGAGIVFIVWLWRARRNAEALCAARHRLSIGWVIGGWFCPVVNFWFPHMVMADVLRASDPQTPPDAPDLRGRPAGALATVWWLSFLAGWVLTFVIVRLGAPEPRSKTTGEYFVYGIAPTGGWGLIAAELIQTAVLAVAAICLGAIIIRVQRWQQARASHPVGGPGTRTPPTTRTSMPWTARPGDGAASVSTTIETARSAPGPVPLVKSSTPNPVPSAQPDPHTLPMRDTDPSTIGPYTLVGRLGSDSVGDLYLGRATDTTKVVIRIVHAHRAADTGDRAELARTFAAARSVHSDFTPAVPAADADAPRPWIATEYVAGHSLHDLVTDHGALPPRVVENTAIAVAHALSALHDAGLVHGALTPSSVIITETGPRVVDFGIPAQTELTAFAAPEQLAGEPGGRASDVFALGSVLAYARTGRAPFGDAKAATLLHRMTTQPPDLTGIPETRLHFVITGCLAGQPDVRLTTAQVLAHLESTASPQPRPSAPTPSATATDTPDPSKGDFRFQIGVIAVVALGVIIAVGISAVSGTFDEPARSGPWGQTQWIADMFPGLIPSKPSPYLGGQQPAASEDGYRGVACQAAGSTEGVLECASDSRTNRIPYIAIYCSKDRPWDNGDGHTLLETSPRPSGTVNYWRSGRQDGITVTFNNLPRSQCAISSAWTGHSMDELLAWWRFAPL